MQCEVITLHRIKKKKALSVPVQREGATEATFNEASTKIDNSTVHISTDKI